MFSKVKKMNKTGLKGNCYLIGVFCVLSFVLCAAGICFAEQSACVNAPSGLISWWPGDGNADDIVDSNPSTAYGATYATGMVSQAFSFDGVDDLVMVPDAANLKPAQLTVDFWMRSNVDLDSNTPTSVYLIPVGKLNPGVDIEYYVNGYDFNYYPSSGFFAFGLSRSGIDRAYTAATGVTFPAGVWHYIAGTYDQNYIKLYIDGMLVGSTQATFPIAYGSAPLLIGGGVKHTLFSPSDQYYNGLIDEVSIYSRALTAEEIAAIYNAGSAGKCKPVCTPGIETCNGIDDDCDGLIDEGLQAVPTTCGIGECASIGQKTCVNGAESDSCTAGTPIAETCDGKDNNCNGASDEPLCGQGTDQDCDAVSDCGTDKCPGTTFWTAQDGLKPNHFDGTNMDLAKTYGCSGSQILAKKPGNNIGEWKYGLTQGTLDVWISQTGWSKKK